MNSEFPPRRFQIIPSIQLADAAAGHWATPRSNDSSTVIVPKMAPYFAVPIFFYCNGTPHGSRFFAVPILKDTPTKVDAARPIMYL